jgi:antitoxin CptB
VNDCASACARAMLCGSERGRYMTPNRSAGKRGRQGASSAAPRFSLASRCFQTLGASLDIETRRRRAAYRAAHRGTKEMDWLIGRYAGARLDGMEEAELASFERFLSLPDPELRDWILDPASLGETDFTATIRDLRRFHGLDGPDTR